MGTKKQFVLAALVSMMLVLTIMLGFLPSYDMRSTQAGDGDRIDLANLLDQMLGTNNGDAKASPNQGLYVQLESNVSGVIVKTATDNADADKLEIPVLVDADVDGGTGEELVTFVANKADDASAWNEIGWVGDQYFGAYSAPYIGGVDVSGFLTGTADMQSSLLIYALVNATAGVQGATLVYDAVNDASDAVEITLMETPAANEANTLDSDSNAFPDDIFNSVAPGEVWVKNVTINGQLRTVLVANLDSGSTTEKALGDIYLSPNGNITVQSPGLDAFVSAGLIAAGEDGVIVVEVVDDLAGLLDTVSNDFASVDEWVAQVESAQPGAMTGMAQYVEISILYTSNGGANYSELEDLTGTQLAVNLKMSNLDVGENDQVQLWSLPTSVSDVNDETIITNIPGEEAWTLVADAPVSGTMLEADLQTLSVFAPFNSGLALTGADVSRLPQGFESELTLSGVMPIASALSVYEAAQAYQITIGGQVAAFREGPAKQGVAITENGANIYVTAPALSVTGPVDIVLTDLANATNTATLTAAVTVQAVHLVTSTVSGSAASIVLDPVSTIGAADEDYYFEGATVTASMSDESTPSQWLVNGSNAGALGSVSFTVAGATTVEAVFQGGGVQLNLSATAGGSIVDPIPAPDLPGGLYTRGTVVTFAAAPVDPALATFQEWTGPSVGLLGDPTLASQTITLNADVTLVANFIAPTYTLNFTVAPEGVGNVTLNPEPGAGNTYLAGTEVTLSAAPTAEGYTFAGWTGANAADLSSQSAQVVTVMMNSDKAVTANFVALNITAIAPDNAWLFGGVVAEITGTGFTNDTYVAIGGTQVFPFRVAGDGTSMQVVVPPSTDNTDNAEVLANVEVREAGVTRTLPDGFTYKRYQTDANGISTTAFIIADNSVETAIDVTLGVGGNDEAEMILPALDAPAGTTVYGIARAVQLTDVADVKTNTSALSAAFGSGNIGTGGVTGDLISQGYDFSLHLYSTADAAKTTPPVGSAFFGNADGLVNFDRPVDDQGNPVATTPIKLSFPVNGAFTYADVKDGLMVWGQGASYDYATDQIAPTSTVAYQSELLANEVSAAIDENTVDVDSPDTVNMARIYGLNVFSLRKAALLPDEVVEAIRLATASGTANGSVDGGTELRIVSPLGGLAWVDRVEFGTLGTQATFKTAAGSTEYELVLDSPEASEAGIVDLTIYLKSNPTTAAATLERVFEYRAASKPLDSLLLLGLGLAIALIGLLAGGDSGGGSGGPCFIASAAYGTPMAEDIDTLRAVRDTFMLDNAVGTAFVDTYYRVSPMLADAVAQSPVLAAVVRVLLVPVIFLGKVALTMSWLTALVGLSIGMMYIMRRKARSQA